MRTISAMVLGAALSLVGGCGGPGVNIPQGPMPQGGSFTGVWHSPQYGEMHMVQTGSQVIGQYTKDERRGRIQGTAEGNVLRFEWTERRELVAGRPITTRGRGYFVYAIDDAGDHNILGRWGVDDDNHNGGEWNAVRDRRRQPQIDSSGSGPDGEGVEEFDTAGSGDDLGGGGGGSDADQDLGLGDL
jgi:hypothetical protein